MKNKTINNEIENNSIEYLKKHLIKNYTKNEIDVLLKEHDECCLDQHYNDLDLYVFFNWMDLNYFLMPIEELPLHINNSISNIRKIAEWRLKIGK